MIGGGGGGRDTMAQAGGKDAEKLDEALEAARAGRSRRSSAVGLTPRPRARLRQRPLRLRGQRPDRHARDAARRRSRDPAPSAGSAEIARLVAEQEAERVVVGLPSASPARRAPQAAEARAFAERLRGALDVPVETYDERFTTALAQAHARAARPRTRAPPRTCSRATSSARR